MGKTTLYARQLLELIFNGTTLPRLADNTVTTPLTVLYVTLHTADPGLGGDQTTSEADYTGYTRISVARTGGGWNVTGNSVSPAAPIDFPLCTGGTNSITHFGVGRSPTGAGALYYSGSITPNINVTTGVIPRISNASTITEA